MNETTPDCVLCERQQHDEGSLPWWSRMFMVCPECGNKRCPRATWHDNTCTHSNEPGQTGSVYGSEPLKLA